MRKDNELDLDIDVDELVGAVLDSVKKDTKSFDDVINLDSALRREVFIGDVCEGLGTTVDGIITFWNRYDEEHNIPVEEREPIRVLIDSNGGSLSDAFIIMDAIKLSKTPIHTVVVGCAYSAAFDICTFGHKRIAYPHSTFLFHEGSTGISGTVNQFQNFAAFNKRLINKTKEYLIENTKITEEKYKEVKNEDWWLDAEEALEWGIIDEILGKEN